MFYLRKIMLEVFNCENFNEIYGIMKQSFPKSEIRSLRGQKALLKDERYKIYCQKEKGEIIGFLCVWNLENYYFLEHFAVKESHRNKGVGKQILSEVVKGLNGIVFLEVEPPETLLQKRRVEFYIRQGFFINDYEYCQPAFSKTLPAVPLKIMTYGREITREEFLMVKSKIYKEVYHQKV